MLAQEWPRLLGGLAPCQWLPVDEMFERNSQRDTYHGSAELHVMVLWKHYKIDVGNECFGDHRKLVSFPNLEDALSYPLKMTSSNNEELSLLVLINNIVSGQ